MPFLSRTHDSRSLLQGRVSLVPSGYIITFDDVTAEVGALAKRDALLREVIELLEHDLPLDARDHARQGYRTLLSGWWPMSDIHSGALFDLVGRQGIQPAQADGRVAAGFCGAGGAGDDAHDRCALIAGPGGVLHAG